MSDYLYGDALFNDFQEMGDDILPRVIPQGGPYTGFIKKAVAGTSKSKGTPQVFYVVQVTEGPEAGIEAVDTIYWSDNVQNRKMTAGFLAKLGLTPEVIKRDQLRNLVAIAERMEGIPVSFTVKYDGEFQGNPNVRLQNVKALGPSQSPAAQQGAVTLSATTPAQPLQAATPAQQAAAGQPKADPWAQQPGGWPQV